jgi:hypothetical protein
LLVSTRWPGNLRREGRTETAKVDALDEEAVENYARAVAGPVLRPPGGVPKLTVPTAPKPERMHIRIR